MKDWLGWDERKQEFTATDQFEEFVGWFYPKSEVPEEADPSDFRGDWEKRRITNRDDIRKISYLIVRAPKYFQLFRDGVEFDDAYGQAMVEQYDRQRELDVDRQKKIISSIKKCAQELSDIPLAMVRDSDVFPIVRKELVELKQAIDFVLNS